MKRDTKTKLVLRHNTVAHLDVAGMECAMGGLTIDTCLKTIDYTISTIDPATIVPNCQPPTGNCPAHTTQCPETSGINAR